VEIAKVVETENKRYLQFPEDLKALAKELNVPVIALSFRAVETRGSK
jgi:replicative DNA helicase